MLTHTLMNSRTYTYIYARTHIYRHTHIYKYKHIYAGKVGHGYLSMAVLFSSIEDTLIEEQQ